MTEYTPEMDALRSGYAASMDDRDMSLYRYNLDAATRAWEQIRDVAYERFDSTLSAYTAKVQADALREAADDFANTDLDGPEEWADVDDWLNKRADSLHPAIPSAAGDEIEEVALYAQMGADPETNSDRARLTRRRPAPLSTERTDQ